MTFPFNPWRKPSALTLAVEQLEQAQRDRLQAAEHAEYYVGMAKVLEERILRLKSDINLLKGELTCDKK